MTGLTNKQILTLGALSLAGSLFDDALNHGDVVERVSACEQ